MKQDLIDWSFVYVQEFYRVAKYFKCDTQSETLDSDFEDNELDLLTTSGVSIDESMLRNGRYHVIETIGNRLIALDSHQNDNLVRIDFKPRPYRNKNMYDSISLDRISKYHKWEEHRYTSPDIIQLQQVFTYDPRHFAFVYPHYNETWSSFPSNFPGKLVPLKLLKKLVADICHALVFMNERHLVHLDIRPETILFDRKSNKSYLLDFGYEHAIYTPMKYVGLINADIQYRAPEVFMKPDLLGPAVDMWSLGVTLFKLVTGKNLIVSFGTTKCDMISNSLFQFIRRVPPSPDALTQIPHPFLRNLSQAGLLGRTFLHDLDEARHRYQLLDEDDVLLFDQLVDLISKCLTWNPRNRLIPQIALKHPFLTL